MKKPKLLVKFTHANLKRPVWVTRRKVFAFYFSEASAAVHVIADGGAVLPVAETIEQVEQLIEKGDLDNGTTTT